MSVVSLDPAIERQMMEDAKRNKNAFGPLYSHYYEHIKRFIAARVSSEEEAEDLTSQVFEKALKNIKKFRWQGVSVSAWFYQIARNTLVDYYRKQGRRNQEAIVDEESYQSDLPDQEQQIDSFFEKQLLYGVLKALPDREKEILHKKFFYGYSNKVIADLMGLSDTNVSTIVNRAMAKLRDEIVNIQDPRSKT